MVDVYGRTVVRQALLPIRGEEAAFFGNDINVVSEGERDDIGVQAVNDSAGLFAGAAVGLLDDDGVAGLFLPIFGEGGVEFLIQPARGVVGNVQEGDIFRPRRSSQNQSGHQYGKCPFHTIS